MTELTTGQIQWHSSEDGGGPDVGQIVALGANRYLWAGEITKHDWTDAGSDAAELGDDFGFWLILHDAGEKTVLGKFVSPEAGRTLIEMVAASLMAPSP